MLSGIIEARMYDIIDFVMLEIERSGYKGKLGAGIVLTGGGATLKNLNLLFKAKMGMEVRVATPTMYLTPESLEIVNSPKYSTIAGIIIDAVRGGRFTEVEERQNEPVLEPLQGAGVASMANDSYASPLTTAQDYYESPTTEADSEQYYDDPEQQTEDDLTTTERRHKAGVFDKFKKMFSNMFEEVDDEDNY